MYRDFMDIRHVKVENGESETILVVNDRVVNHRDILHGGAMADLLDSAGSSAVHSALGPGLQSVTATITVEFLLPVPKGSTLIAYGHAVHVGRGIASARCEARLNGELAATATGLWRIIPKRDAEFNRTRAEADSLRRAWQQLDLTRLREVPPAQTSSVI